jgi:hypothetical protein
MSAVKPAHNVAETLEKTLESLLAQPASAWQAIVDGNRSPGNKSIVAARFADRAPHICTTSQPQSDVRAAPIKSARLTHPVWLFRSHRLDQGPILTVPGHLPLSKRRTTSPHAASAPATRTLWRSQQSEKVDDRADRSA